MTNTDPQEFFKLVAEKTKLMKIDPELHSKRIEEIEAIIDADRESREAANNISKLLSMIF